MQDVPGALKWPKAIPLKDTTAKSVAGVLLSVILMWGPPVELLSNQGPEFVAELSCKLLRQGGIKRQYAAAYHPQTKSSATMDGVRSTKDGTWAGRGR